jgi:hypothetical protein
MGRHCKKSGCDIVRRNSTGGHVPSLLGSSYAQDNVVVVPLLLTQNAE